MRTESRWHTVYMPKVLKLYFPPRLAKDLAEIPFLPKTETVKSSFIYGAVNTGKTILAAQMMLQEMKNLYLEKEGIGTGFLFVSFPDMLAEIRSTYGENAQKTELQVLEKYNSVGLLVIDDFMATRPTSWVMDVIYQLVNHRYEYEKKTIFTSNNSLGQLEDILGDQRITSRIDRMCELIEKMPY